MGILSSISKGIKGLGGAIVGAGASILGGVMGSREAEKDREAAAEQARLNYEQQKEFAQHGIRWKMEDAIAAGLHPLYALGGSSAAFSPNPIVVGGDRSMGRALADAGQNLGRAIQAQQTSAQRIAEAQALELQAAQIDETDARADYYRSQAARNAQFGVGSSPFPMAGQPNRQETFEGQYDRILPKASEQESMSSNFPGAQAKITPFWGRYQTDDGQLLFLPYSDEGPSEVLENIPLWFWPSIVEYNRRKLGQSAVDALKGLIPFVKDN